MTRIIFLLLAFGFSNCQGQKKYAYSMCVFKRGTSGKILTLKESVDFIDDRRSLAYGKVYDGPTNRPIDLVNVVFIDTLGLNVPATTDSTGNYQIYLEPGIYFVKYLAIGHVAYTITNLLLKSGKRQEINIELGTGQGFQCIQYVSDKRLNKRQIRKKERELSDD